MRLIQHDGVYGKVRIESIALSAHRRNFVSVSTVNRGLDATYAIWIICDVRIESGFGLSEPRNDRSEKSEMRQLTRDYRISAPSIAEVHRGLSHEAERAYDELGLTVQGPKRSVEPKGAHVVNWLACHLLTLPLEERNKILKRGKAILDRHLESDAPVKFGLDVTTDNGGEQGGAATGRRKRGA